MGIGPTRPAWKAGILPLNYARKNLCTLNQNAFKVYHDKKVLSMNFGKIYKIIYNKIEVNLLKNAKMWAKIF